MLELFPNLYYLLKDIHIIFLHSYLFSTFLNILLFFILNFTKLSGVGYHSNPLGRISPGVSII